MHFLGCWHALGPTPPYLSVFPEGRTMHSALHMGRGMQTPPPHPDFVLRGIVCSGANPSEKTPAKVNILSC